MAHLRGGDLRDVSILGDSDGTDGHLILGPMELPSVSLRNHRLSTDVTIDWDRKVFPYCWIWMVLGGIRQWPLWGRERLLTVEPFSSPVISLTDAIAQGSALQLGPHEKVATWVSLEVQAIPNQRESG